MTEGYICSPCECDADVERLEGPVHSPSVEVGVVPTEVADRDTGTRLLHSLGADPPHSP